MEKLDTAIKQSITKEDFIKSDSSSSSADQGKKITKKQAKKMAKENRKKQESPDDNEQLANKVSKITLQPNQEERKSDGTNDNRKTTSEEQDDNLSDMKTVSSRPTIYRRHMSESNVELQMGCSGEFKLKVKQRY